MKFCHTTDPNMALSLTPTQDTHHLWDHILVSLQRKQTNLPNFNYSSHTSRHASAREGCGWYKRLWNIHLCFSPVYKHVWIQWGWLVSARVAEGILSSCIRARDTSSASHMQSHTELQLASLKEGLGLSTGGRKAHTAHPDTLMGAELQPCKPPLLHCALEVKGE